MRCLHRRPTERTAQPEIQTKDLTGLKFFRKIRPLLRRLHDIGSKRDRAGNRDVYMDESRVFVLMWLFNPILTSLRGLQQATQLEAVSEKFGVGRASPRIGLLRPSKVATKAGARHGTGAARLYSMN